MSGHPVPVPAGAGAAGSPRDAGPGHPFASPARDDGGLIAVARVARTQGRRGELRLLPLTDAPERLRELGECYLVPPEEGERRRVENVWFQGEAPVVKLAGSDTLDQAEALVGRLLTIPRGAARPLPPDRFYAFDLVGCRVETPDGAALGVLTDVWEGAGHDLWVVRDGTREWLAPAVGAIVERVDLPGRRVIVRPPDGLVELES